MPIPLGRHLTRHSELQKSRPELGSNKLIRIHQTKVKKTKIEKLIIFLLEKEMYEKVRFLPSK